MNDLAKTKSLPVMFCGKWQSTALIICSYGIPQIGACPRLQHIAVHIGISDYFSDTDAPENIRKYKHIVDSLEVL